MSSEADQAKDQGPELVSEFPPPPKFFALYKDGPGDGPAPPPPLSPTYYSFGTPYSTKDMVPDLLPDPTKKLYKTTDQTDFKGELKKLNFSLVVSFVQLIEVLIRSPDHFNDKLNDIELLFLNMHNLVNSYRPHQARETLIEHLKLQIKQRREATEEIRKCIEEAKDAISGAHQLLDEGDDIDEQSDHDSQMEVKEEKRASWSMDLNDKTDISHYQNFMTKIAQLTECI